MKTLYVNIYKAGRVVHTATIRNDDPDFEVLRERFDGCYMRSKSQTCPVWFIGQKDHNTHFDGLKKYANK